MIGTLGSDRFLSFHSRWIEPDHEALDVCLTATCTSEFSPPILNHFEDGTHSGLRTLEMQNRLTAQR